MILEMPTAGSQHSRYIIPAEINPEGVCCICVPVPDSPEYRAQFFGAIWRMGIQSHYERDEAHSGKLVAAVWRKIWEDLQVAGCCRDGASANFNIYIKNIQTQIYIHTLTQLWIASSFDVQVAFLGTPDNFDTDAGDAGPEVASRERALCMISQSYVDEMFNTGMSWIEDSAIGITAIGVGALAVPIIPIWVIGAGFSAVALALSSLYTELQRTEYRHYMACALYEALKGVSTGNRGAFADAWDNLPARPPPAETPSEDIARDAIEAWARAQLALEGNYVAFVSQLKAAMEIATELTDNDCLCLGVWEHTFLNGHGEQMLEYPEICDGLVDTYNVGEDRREGICCDAPSNFAIRAHEDLNFLSSTITRVRMYVDYVSTRTTSADKLRIWHSGDQLMAEMGVAGSNDVVVDTGVVSISMTELNFRSLIASSDGTCPDTSGARCWIWKIVVNGDGADPFLPI